MSTLGVPSIVQRTLVRPPSSRLGPAQSTERAAVLVASPVRALYDRTVDRESAAEMLAERAAQRRKAPAEPDKPAPTRRSNRQGIGEAAIKSVARSMGSSLGRAIMRGLLGSFSR